MKLAELKRKFKNKYTIRIVAGVLIVAVLGSTTAAYNVYAAKSAAGSIPAGAKSTQEDVGALTENSDIVAELASDTEDDDEIKLEDFLKDDASEDAPKIGKDETVYIIADSAGKAETTIVSEWLKNPEGRDTLEDVSDLEEIENVKGNEAFEKKGTALSWNAAGKDIYYQGKTTKEAPVTEQLTYYLDGKKIEPDDLAGKSGKVTIRFDYTNHEKKGDIYVPFTVVSGMLLDDSFSNIEVTNGKVISNGDGNLVFGVAMPGLKESLKVKDSDFSDDFSIPEYVEVTADVENFALDMTMTVVAGGSELMGDKTLDLSELDEKIGDLTDAMEQLKDGSGELSDGLATLDDKMGEFSDGVHSLQSGIAAYTDGAKTLADGIGTLKGQSVTLISGISDLVSSVRTLNDGVKTLDSSLNTAMSGKEKAAASQTARTAAEAAVEAQLADDSNPQSYHNIKAQAEAQFEATLTSDESLAAVKQQASDTVNAQSAQIAAQAVQAADASLQQNGEIQAQLQQLSAAVQAAGQLQYAQSDAGKAAIAEQAAGMAQQLLASGFAPEQVAALQDILAAAASANVIVNDGNGQAAGQAAAQATVAGLKQAITGSAGQVAVAAAQTVAPQTAEATVRGVAGQAKGSIGTSMAESVKTAAKSAAGQAAAQAAVEGAETAKQTIAQSIEKKNSTSGYSLVSGMAALNDAVQGMSGKMPQLTEGIDKLYTGSQTLASKNDELNSGASKLADGKNQLTDGVKKLSEGSKELSDGIIEFDEKGIEKMVNSYNGSVKDFADRVQEVLDAGKAYESFGGKADHTTGNVKFVIKTGAVKAEE